MMNFFDFADELDKVKDNDYSDLESKIDKEFEDEGRKSIYVYCVEKTAIYVRLRKTKTAYKLIGKYKKELMDLHQYHRLYVNLLYEELRYEEAIKYIDSVKNGEASKDQETANNAEDAKEQEAIKNEIKKLDQYKVKCLYYLKRYDEIVENYEAISENDEYCKVSRILSSDKNKDLKDFNDPKRENDDIKHFDDLNNQDYFGEFYQDYGLLRYIIKKDDSKLKRFLEINNLYKAIYSIIKYSKSLNYEPDYILGWIIKNNYDNIYKSDESFKTLIYHINDKETRDTYIKIWFWAELILVIMMVKNDDRVNHFCHYTTKETCLNLVKGVYSLAKFSLANSNDIAEGNVLSAVLQKNGIDNNINCFDNSPYIPLQISFSRNEDNLTMFRLYGKENNEEGTGVCLVFNKNFFKTDLSQFRYEDTLLQEETKEKVKGYKDDTRTSLIWILYYDEEKNTLHYYPDDELKAYTIDLNSESKWNDFDDSDTQKQTECRLSYAFRRIFELINSLKTSDDKQFAVQILHKLRFLIKSKAFIEEKECRVLELVRPNTVSLSEKNVCYKDYKKITEIEAGIDKIIIGSKVSIPKVIKEVIQNKLNFDLPICVSKAPLA